MFLKELIRFSTQHRTLYCYMILSIWIFLLIAGMYKYIGRNSSSLSYILNGKSQYYSTVMTASPSLESSNFAKYKTRCTALTQINRLDDGGILDGWKLQGVLLVIRHGDRGPMSHVRNIPHLDCGITGDNLVNKYRSFLYNSTSVSGSNHMYWNKVGPFHSFPLLPLAEKECLLGQLTYNDCACPQADALRKELMKIQKQRLNQQPLVANVMHWIGNQLLQHTPNGINDPNEVVDAMLTVMCHDAPWPCRNLNASEQSTASTKPSDLDLNDVINIDQDDIAVGGGGGQAGDDLASNLIELQNGNMETPTTTTEGCIESHHVSTLMSFANFQSTREVHHSYYKRIGLMRAYGMIRHIVSYMLRMISGDRTKFVLYSGHDWTLQYLTAALGIQTDNTFIAYAARLAFEVYKSEAHTDYYFRVVYDGHDVTKQIDFCEGGKSLRVTRDSRGNKADLCPIENIIRFLHEDYFGPLNATNFKDACILQQQKPNEF
ncbi:2-phosphoxylose phosphatase 1 isoform 2-T2 [Cochliomyia hominivorax]